MRSERRCNRACLFLTIVAIGSASCGGSTSATGGTDGGLDGSLVPPVESGPEASSEGADAASDVSRMGTDATTTGATGADAGAVDGADAPSWTPSTLGSKLAFWFDPMSIVAVGGNVAKWSDLSGNGNDAIQATSSYEPTYTMAGIGGLPSVTFNSQLAFLEILDSATMQWGTSDFALFAVIRATANNTAPEGMLFQKVGPSPYSGPALFLNSDKPVTSTLAAAQVSAQLYALSASPPTTFDDSSVHLLGGVRSGATLEIRVDGALSNSSMSAAIAVLDVSAPGSDALIGNNGPAGFRQYNGDIGEFIGVNGTLSPSDLASIEGYLKGRYSIP
jgi:hypothetical protein